ncbi:MAG TPA: hypothetical protein VFO12_00485 [Sphingomicrobium sp.]|nr:hypothetical protein [Sphingomicrobium sp.]
MGRLRSLQDFVATVLNGDADTVIMDNGRAIGTGSPDEQLSALVLGVGYESEMPLSSFVATNYLNVAPGQEGAFDVRLLQENSNNLSRLEKLTGVVEGWAQSDSAFAPYASNLRTVVDSGLATFQNDWNQQGRDFAVLYGTEAASQVFGGVAGKLIVKGATKAAPYVARTLSPAVDYFSPAAQRLIARGRLPAETMRALGPRPAGMINPHRHHILSLNGTAGAERALVREGQDILRSAGIDPVKGVENLVWAPNKGHTLGATQALVTSLREVAGSPKLILRVLREHGQIAAGR